MDLFQSVSEGLYIMLARNMDFSPAAEDLPFTIQVIYQDLCDHGFGDDDCSRIEHALNMIGRTCQRWPTTKTIIDSVPPKHQTNIPMLKKLESDEEKKSRLERGAENMRRIKAMARELASRPVEKREKPEPEYNETELLAGRKAV